MEYESDPRHAELIVKSLNLESAKGLTILSVKKRLENVLTTSPQLDTLQTRKYRGVVMRAAYLSQDRSDLSYSTKELTRDMQEPTEQSMTNLKRLGRYLKKNPRLVQFVRRTNIHNKRCTTGRTMRPSQWLEPRQFQASQRKSGKLGFQEPVPCVEHSPHWTRLIWHTFERRSCLMKSVPRLLKGAFRNALQIAIR